MTPGEFIRKRRLELGLSLTDLEARLNLRGIDATKANVGHWERGRHNPPIENLAFRKALALALEVDINELSFAMGLIETMESNHTRESMMAAEIIDRLPSDARELALDYLQLLEKRFVEQN